jgi:hypothetical protein
VRQAPQPAQFVGVQADDAEIGHGALSEVELVVGADRGHVGVVVAGRRHAVHDHGALAGRVDPDDPARAALRYVEIAVVPAQAGDRRGEILGDQRPAVRAVQSPYAPAGLCPGEAQAGFGDVHPAGRVNREAGREVQSIDDHGRPWHGLCHPEHRLFQATGEPDLVRAFVGDASRVRWRGVLLVCAVFRTQEEKAEHAGDGRSVPGVSW